MRRFCFLWALVVLLISVPAFAKNDKNKKKHDFKKHADKDVGEWARRTEGHRPQDQNGDGLITRNEWPGNDVSFRRLDRNGDGVLTNDDRKLHPKNGSTHDYRTRRFADVDLNKDGRVTPGEWRHARSDFKTLDRNRDGVLTPDEFRW